MATTRRLTGDDLFRMASTNLDPLTETYNMSFYLNYLCKWPGLCMTQETPSGRVQAYIIGKAEGAKDNWHGHISAVTVAAEYRRLGSARVLARRLETESDVTYRGHFADLFVRLSNTVAIKMYAGMGYTVYRRVLNYYGGEEDALDMRKALSRDTERKSIVPLRRPVTAYEMQNQLTP